MRATTTLMIAVFALMMSTAIANAGHRYGPSFDCRYATKRAEHAICASRHLSRLDRRLAYWYRKAKERARYFGQTRWLRNSQRRWLRRRNACGGNRFCIAWHYRMRIRQLRNYYEHV